MKKETAVQKLQELPGVTKVNGEARDTIRIQTADGEFTLPWRDLRSLPGRRALESLSSPLLLTLPYVPRSTGDRLRELGVNYLDESGNISLQIGRVTIWVTGHPPPPAPAASSELRAAGHRVLGAALATPALFQRPLREIAAECGVSTSPVLSVRDFLQREGCLIKTRSGLLVVERLRLLDRWLHGYRDLVRPRLLVGRYLLPGSIDRLAQAMDHTLSERWAWGGSQASLRRFSIGTNDDLILHIAELKRGDVPRLPLRASPDGPIEVLAIPFLSAWGDREQTSVSPLLQLAEIACRPDDRSREVTASLREHITHQWNDSNE